MLSQNESMWEISSKSDNGKVFKNRGNGFWGRGEFGGWGGGNFEIKYKPHKCHPKLNLCRKSNPNRKMGKYSKIGGIVFWERGGGGIRMRGGILRKKNANLTNTIPK